MKIAVALLALGVATGCAGTFDESSWALTHVSVLDVRNGRIETGQTVLIRRNRIISVGPTETMALARNTRRIDAGGKFLIRGLWDMHVHTFFGDRWPGGRDSILPLFVANGGTGVRDMGSDLVPVWQARRDIEDGRLLGPRMVVAGPMLDGPDTPTRD